MSESKPPSVKVLEFAAPQEAVEIKIENWIREMLNSNDDLVAALERLRASYCSLFAGKKPVKDAGEILAQVEIALTKAQRTRNVV